MKTLRTFILLPLFALVLSLSVFAGGDSVKDLETSMILLADEHPVLFKRAVDNYVACLKSDNCGVVESALAHVVKLRIAFPNESFTDVSREVTRLAASGSTPYIRFKAALTRQVFENTDLPDLADLPDTANPDAFFSELGVRLSRTLVRR